MKPNLPSGLSLVLWKVHFALAIACAIGTCWRVKLEHVGTVGVVALDAFDIGWLALGALLLAGSLAAEGGWLAQRPLGRLKPWRVLFWIVAASWILSGLGIAFVLVFLMTGGAIDPLPRVSTIDVFYFAVGLGQLYALWRYAYRSDYLWDTAFA
jgi:hypothetical protein